MNDLKGIIEDCNKSDLVSKEAIKKIIEIIGQEEWNYLYDENSNICTTMGELIITLKGIPELEKEIAELKAYNEKLLDGDIEKHNKIVELKEQLDALANVNIKAQNIIGKAKEIIRDLLFHLGNTFIVSYTSKEESITKAEQFLKEVKE